MEFLKQVEQLELLNILDHDRKNLKLSAAVAEILTAYQLGRMDMLEKIKIMQAQQVAQEKQASQAIGQDIAEASAKYSPK